VIPEELAVEMSRIPIDQHAAEVEHHDVSDRLCHCPASEFRTRLDDSKRNRGALRSATWRAGNRSGVMLASIWLQLRAEEEASLGALIAMLASAHGTVPFQPHLTVCSPRSNPDSWDAAAEYIRGSRLLPLSVRKKRISYSTTAPMRAVVIDVEAAADLQGFREDLRRIPGAVEPHPPHISLLYSVEETGRQPSWSADESR